MNDYVGLFDDWSYWSSHGTAGTVEVDFLLRQGKRLVAIEAKAGRRFKPEMLKGLQAIGELPTVKRRLLVYGGKDSWQTDDRVEVMAVERFRGEIERGL